MQTYILKEVRDAIKDAMIDRGYVPDALNASDFDVDLADWFPHIAGWGVFVFGRLLWVFIPQRSVGGCTCVVCNSVYEHGVWSYGVS